jgi:hypothetical protein
MDTDDFCVWPSKREICNSESNRHQTIDVLFDGQKDT